MKRATHLLFLIITVCAFTACSGSKSISTNPADIQGEWQLTSLDGNQIQTGEDGAYTLSFNADSTIAGRADCNYFAGKYTAAEQEGEGSLSLNSISTTKATCGEQSNYEAFVQSVQGAESFLVQNGGSQLVLTGGGAGKVVFSRVEAEEEG